MGWAGSTGGPFDGYGNLPLGENKKGGGGSSGYHYGWPSGGTLEPDVIAQWKMDEAASGPIIDEVGGITLTAQYGPMTYKVSGTGDWSAFTGITFPGYSTYGDFKNDVDGSCSLGTERDFVCESVLNCATSTGYGAIFSCEDNATSYGWYVCPRGGTSTRWYAQFTATDTTFVTASILYTHNPLGDGNIHKFRFVGNSSAKTIELFVDGVSEGSADLTSLVGKDISATHTNVGSAANGNNPFMGTCYEVRVTIGNSTNNSGGPGGG